MTKLNQEQKKIINLHLSSEIMFRVKEMAKTEGVSMSEMIRRSIAFQYDHFNRKRFGYKGAIVMSQQIFKKENKQRKDAAEELILSMSDEELTAHLRSIGYFSEDTTDELAGIIIQDRITEINNVRGYWQLRYNIQDKNYEYKRFVYNMEELIKDLKKEKKI